MWNHVSSFLGRAFVVWSVAGTVLLLTCGSGAQTYQFIPIDVPCSDCPGGIARQTIAEGINAAGAIVGTFKDAANAQHGFLLLNGQVAQIDVPSAIATVATGINPAGTIVGRYTTAVGSPGCSALGTQCTHGFVYTGTAPPTTLVVQGHAGSFAQRIAPDGTIYGCLHDFDLMGSMYGAIWTRFGQTSSLTAGGGELADADQSVPASMNNGATPDGHTIVGHFTEMETDLVHGFFVQDGVLLVYDVPGSTFTQIWDINPGDAFVGTYRDSTGKQHGFVQIPGEPAPITLDYPGSASTVAFGINPAGDIVGQYTTNGVSRGFLAKLVVEQ